MLVTLGPSLDEIRADYMERALAAMNNPKKYWAKRAAPLWESYSESMETTHDVASMEKLYQQFIEDLADGR
jgi:hypothetical protein